MAKEQLQGEGRHQGRDVPRPQGVDAPEWRKGVMGVMGLLVFMGPAHKIYKDP